MRLIDADALLEELKLSSNMHAENSREFSLLHRNIVIVNEQPTVDAIPVAFIESEKQRVQGMIEYAVKMGMMAEAERLSSVIAVLDAVVSNWRYTTGPDWRAERKEE